MPELPTFTVTSSVAERLLAAFSGEVDDVTGEPITPQKAYKRWLRSALVSRVQYHEMQQHKDALESEMTL